MSDNFAYLRERLMTIEESRNNVIESLTMQSAYYRIIETELLTLKPIMLHLRKQRSRLNKYVYKLKSGVEVHQRCSTYEESCSLLARVST